jgi:dTMP kinase
MASSSPSLPGVNFGSTSVADNPVFSVQHRPDQLIAISPESEALLFNAARAQLVQDIIRPALDDGLIVVLDRYVDSTIAYQAYGRRGDLELISAICEFATGGLLPRRTFLLDVSPDVRHRRRALTPQTDRFEQSDDTFHARVRSGYLALAAADPVRFAVLDASGDEREIGDQVRREVERLLPATTLTPP